MSHKSIDLNTLDFSFYVILKNESKANLVNFVL